MKLYGTHYIKGQEEVTLSLDRLVEGVNGIREALTQIDPIITDMTAKAQAQSEEPVDRNYFSSLWQQLDVIGRWGEMLSQEVYTYLQEGF